MTLDSSLANLDQTATFLIDALVDARTRANAAEKRLHKIALAVAEYPNEDPYIRKSAINDLLRASA